MQGFVDIHSHILSGVDDGAKDQEMSLRMLRTAKVEGIEKIILTPHNKPGHHNIPPEKIRLFMAQLQGAADREKLGIKLYPGNEIYYRSGAEELLSEGNACTLSDTVYVLLEFGPMDDFRYIKDGIYRMMAGGYQPVLAHAERYANVGSDPAHVEELVEMGCYIQVNADSIMGKAGYGAKAVTKRFLKQHLVHFVATDAHNDEKRSPKIADCAAYVSKKYGADYMRRLFFENQERLLLGDYL